MVSVIKRNLLLIFAISFTAQVPLTALRFVVPLYAQNHGANIFIIGLLGTIYGLVYFLSAIFFGRISDKVGHRSLAIIGVLSYAFIAFSYNFFNNPYEFLLGRALEGISNAMIWPTFEALTSETGGQNKENALLLYTISWSIASSISTYVASILIKYGVIYPLIFASLSSFLSFIFLLFPRKIESSEFQKKDNGFSLIFDIVIPMLFYGFSSSIFYSFYSVYGLNFGFGEKGAGLIGAFYGIFLSLAFISAWLLSNRINLRYLVFSGYFMEITSLIILLNHSFIISLIISSILGFGTGFVYFSILMNIFRSFHANIGSKTGIFESSIGFGYVIGPFISGIPSSLGYLLPWLVTGLFSVSVFSISIIYAKKLKIL